jgi:hypothetical protein
MRRSLERGYASGAEFASPERSDALGRRVPRGDLTSSSRQRFLRNQNGTNRKQSHLAFRAFGDRLQRQLAREAPLSIKTWPVLLLR